MSPKIIGKAIKEINGQLQYLSTEKEETLSEYSKAAPDLQGVLAERNARINIETSFLNKLKSILINA